MQTQRPWRRALKAAFPYTIPVFAGFWFLGLAYGIYMKASGFSFLYPMFMSMTVFAGSLEFLAVDMIKGVFAPLAMLGLTVMVNARHLFYGLSMLEKYKGLGRKRIYLIFGLCDETFSVNCTVSVPEGIDRGWFYFWVTALNHCYWVLGSTLGGVFGSFIRFSTEGMDFVMTAIFVVIFMEHWKKEERHISSLAGVGLSFLCLLLFGADSFVLPAMGAILVAVTLLRPLLEKGGEKR